MIEGAKNLRDFLLSLSPILYPERSVAESLKPLSSFFQPSGAFSLADLDRLKRTGPARHLSGVALTRPLARRAQAAAGSGPAPALGVEVPCLLPSADATAAIAAASSAPSSALTRWREQDSSRGFPSPNDRAMILRCLQHKETQSGT